MPLGAIEAAAACERSLRAAAPHIVLTRFLPPLATDGRGAFHALGTDRFGRDVWTRLVYGARVSLGVGGLAVLLSLAIGVAVGAVAGHWGGPVRTLLLGITDFALALPRVVLLLLLAALWRPNAALVIVCPPAGIVLLLLSRRRPPVPPAGARGQVGPYAQDR